MMRRSLGRLAVQASLLSVVALPACAVPSINVALQTSFAAPPYLVELLETAAEENATSYFPILDRIADGYFDAASTDEELYTTFRLLLQQDGHLSRPEDLTSFDFALSIHSAAPRVEAHFQYYNTSAKPSIGPEHEQDCETWLHVPFAGLRYCTPGLVEASAQTYGKPGEGLLQLPIDRILGPAASSTQSILYADITSLSFRHFHKTLVETAKDGKTSYRLRYKPSRTASKERLTVSGYGVELSLKRTDYIVIDDRQADDEHKDVAVPNAEATFSEEEVADLRPLSASELLRLGLKAASFVLASDAPIDTLLRLSQDFPKHSGSVAAMNVSDEFQQEHLQNREVLLPGGFNVMWINGVQIMPRDVDAYSLLEHLRRERKMINGVRELGLTGPEAIMLLSHEAITASAIDPDVPRYDWRDDTDGGNIIMWMNDIEKDKRYADWPGNMNSLLQRTYPGQLPPVRLDVHNLVIPIDFADYADVLMVVDTLQNFVKRKVPIRFGLVPHIKSPASAEQARMMYHLLEVHGLSAALSYLGTSISGAGRRFGPPQQQYFSQAIADRKVRAEREPIAFVDISDNVDLEMRVQSAQRYIARLGAHAAEPPILINGVPIPRSDEWLQAMSQRVSVDSRIVQQAIFEELVTDDTYLPDLFLAKASLRRNSLIVPEDDKAVRHLDLIALPSLAALPSLVASSDTIEHELVHLTVIADFDSLLGFSQALEAMLFQRQHDNVEIALLHIPAGSSHNYGLGTWTNRDSGAAYMHALLKQYDALVGGDEAIDGAHPLQRDSIYKQIFDASAKDWSGETTRSLDQNLASVSEVIDKIGDELQGVAILLNGRFIGPMPQDASLGIDDFEALLSYERKKRLLPTALAIRSMNLEAKASTPFAFAKISNLIALSQVSDVPDGIFEAAPTVRTDIFKKWNSSHTAIKVGDIDDANIQIFAAIDPASEVAQRWIPIIKLLSELRGVYTSLFINPQDRLEELPIKRFYRHVLDPKPTFTSDGALQGHSAKFTGLPVDALLNVGLDLPPSWLVAPKDSVHDLDNIKLSALKAGSNIEAIYELEHILIEGHSRDVTLGPPPRGAQLVLRTELDPHFADTIVMANLGYFQFKANPGIYNLALQKGRSEQIFHIDSAGTLGYNPQPGDNGTEIALMSFRGATLFPRLSRKPGSEDEDVLETPKSALESLAEGAEMLLAQAGLPKAETSKYLSKAAKFGSALLSRGIGSTDSSADLHADINIFSVASGHLYERMLNIMMLSVMKNTNHTVKFWFIEQFLSPSFKSFVPVLAEEYGFKYEMVTYKWPHWLRSQKEKQREIWGYKILFLDVLFPLDLDKVIFVDADQIVRTDMYELVQHDLEGAPYGFTPMCDSRTEMEGFRFWKQGYWKNFLRGLPYHISALYVVDLNAFRQMAAGDRLRQQYHQLSADPASLSNLDQDLPNHMQMALPIHSLPQDWLWCETWCSDEALKTAKTIDLCNNPQTKEPKLDRARRQVPEWTVYDDEIAAVAKRHKAREGRGKPVEGDAADAGPQDVEGESIQERLQREDAEKERAKKVHVRDEL